MAKKHYRVEAHLPQLTAHHADQSAAVEATRLPVAAYRGLRAILSRPEVKGRHLREVHLKIFVQG